MEITRIGVLGVGAIGGLIGGSLARAGYDVTLIDTWAANIEKIKANGITVKTLEEEFTAKATALHLGDVSAAKRSFDIVFLAPAVDFRLFQSAMEKYGHRVGNFRLFGMSDTLEKDDPMAQDFLGKKLASVVYPHSLLYFVSGLLEGREVDTPILGMQRFFDKTDTFNREAYPEVQWAREKFSEHSVWSISDTADGRRSTSRQHGGFDNDETTLVSLRHLIQLGYQP